jgi:hypothetical protein
VAESTELERDLRVLEAELRKLETEYNMFFSGQLPRPPWDTRRRVEGILRRYDRAFIQSAIDRFRLSTMQARFSTFAELWDRGLRAREEGRPGPFSRTPRQEEPAAPTEPVTPVHHVPEDRVVRVATVADPVRDENQVEALYESLIEARQAVGTAENFPFHRFVQIVKTQVAKLREAGSSQVAFRVAVKDGKVTFTAKGMKGGGGGDADRGGE